MSENQGDQGGHDGSDKDKQKKGPRLFKPADAQPKIHSQRLAGPDCLNQ